MAESTSNDHFGDYQIKSEIGRSSTGVIYSAIDPSSDTMVAIKTLIDDLDSNQGEALRKQFQREVDIIAKFEHPNILAVFGLHDEAGVPYLVMEPVDGRDLKSLMTAGDHFTPQEVVVIIQQVLAGLKHIHAKSILHRNVQPENIFLLDNKRVKLTGFGTATNKKISKLTETDSLDTVNYKAPEQLKDNDQVDKRTDLYSVGMILFELLCSESSNQVIVPSAKNLRDNPILVSPDELIKYIPGDFVKLVSTALQASPDDRYQNSAQFSSAILKSYKSYLSQNTDHGLPNPNTRKVDNKQTASKTNRASTQSPAANPDTAKPAKKSARKTKHVSLDRIPFNQWDVATFQKLEMILTQYMGPFAKMLVQHGTSSHNTLKQFLVSLALRIPNRSEKSLFIRQAAHLFEHAAATHSNVKKIRPRTARVQSINDVSFQREALIHTQQHLAYFLGPIAKALVIKEAKQSENRGDLYRRLAVYIPVTKEKDEFLSRAPYKF